MAHAARFVSVLDQMRSHWDALAARDALEASRPGSAGQSAGAFFATGQALLDRWSAPLSTLANGREANALTALDYGCGAGRLLPALGARFGNVFALDLSPTMLARARTLVPPAVSPHFVQGDGMTLQSVRRHRFDLILAVDVLPHFPDPGLVQYVLRQFANRLKPEGLAIVELAGDQAGAGLFEHTGLLVDQSEAGPTTWIRARRYSREPAGP